MKEIIVYHGGTEIVEHPNCRIGRRNLDFGQGFYDRVVDTVNLYIAGLMDEETALRRLSEHRPNNQMCLLSQSLTDKYLIFDGTDDI